MIRIKMPAILLALSTASVAFAQGGQDGSGTAAQPPVRGPAQVEDALARAGIRDVRPLDAAYLVSAVTKDGEHVTFAVTPAAPTTPSSAAGGQAALTGQQQLREDLEKAGFTSVRVLDSSHLATGLTRSGDTVTMTIDPSTRTGAAGTLDAAGGTPPTGGSAPATGDAAPGATTTGQLPDQSLAEKRQGAIGQAPEPVDQGGAASPDATATGAPDGALPEGNLPEKRTGTIGSDPNPVVQGGGADPERDPSLPPRNP